MNLADGHFQWLMFWAVPDISDTANISGRIVHKVSVDVEIYKILPIILTSFRITTDFE